MSHWRLRLGCGPLVVIRAFLLAAVALNGTACTRSTTVDSGWADNVPRNQTFSKVLVIGVTPNYNIRCRFERMMRDSLSNDGVTAVTSCSLMGSKDPLTREAIIPLVGSIGADAVLTTRLVDGKARMEEGGGSEARGKAYYKATGYGYWYDPYYGAYGMPVTYVDFVSEQSTFTLTRTVVISSNLYETRNGSLVYGLDTTAHDQTSVEAVIDVVTLAIAERLRRDGLVP